MIPRALEIEILRLHQAEHWPINTIARQLEVHHSAVCRVLSQANVLVAQKTTRPVNGRARTFPDRGSGCGVEFTNSSLVAEQKTRMSISPEIKAQILRYYHVEQWRTNTIARHVGVHHGSVERVLAHAGLPSIRAVQRPLEIDGYRPFVRQTLEKFPTLTASRLYMMVRERGYRGSPDHFRHLIGCFRPRPKTETHLRLRTLPGEQAYMGWAKFGELTVGPNVRALVAFVMVLSYSHQLFLRFYLGTSMNDFIRGHVEAFASFNAVPRALFYHWKGVLRDRWCDEIRFHPTVLELATHYRFEPRPVGVTCRDEKKGLLDAISFVRESFFAACTYRDLDDLNTQARAWCDGPCFDRLCPADRTTTVRALFAKEQPCLLALPESSFVAFSPSGLVGLNPSRKQEGTGERKTKADIRKQRVLEILHDPPGSFEINRASWSLTALAAAYTKKHGEPFSRGSVRVLLKRAGYSIRKARRVLTSPDPEYREKVEQVLNALQTLQHGELFFFIDELGPLRVKKYGGRTIVLKGNVPTYPQVQTYKGSITMAGALSATANQVTWIYGPRKDTRSMIDLIEILFNQHANTSRIFLTWDAASWHGSNMLLEWLDDFNANTELGGFGPIIQLVPLPTSSQFLDVIEAVFSGMKKAVIHYSDYQSEMEMKTAISRHFYERNVHFKENPKRAGKKIWGGRLLPGHKQPTIGELPRMVTEDDLFLVDSTFLLKAAEASFLGASLLVDSEGRDHTHSFGIVRDLLRLRRRLGIRRAAIIVGQESIAETSENVLSDLIELLRRIKGTVVRQDADRVVDICAYLGASARWIVSRERAMSQLATDDLGLVMPSDDSEPVVVTKKSLADLGIRPDQVPALLALSDGKEAPFKKAQAIRLLELYGSLEAALADASTAPSTDWKRKLGLSKERLIKKEVEIRLRPDTRITQSHDLGGAFIEDSKESADALRGYGFWSLTRLLPLPDGANVVATTSTKRKTAYKAVRNDADLRSLEECLSKASICAIDTETSGKDPCCATLFGISLSVTEGQAYFVPMMNTDLDGISHEEVRSRLNKVLSRNLKLVGHNLKYDFAVLQRNGFDPKVLYFDTMLAAYDCFGDWEFWNLAAVAKKLLGVSVRRYRDIVGEGETFLDRPFKELVDHACSDADVALRLHGALSRELRKRQIEQRFFDVTMQVERFLIDCERDGVCVDTGRMEKVKDAAKITVDALRASVIASAGVEFDIDSPKAVADTLRKLGIWEKTTRPVRDSQLEQLAGEHALAAMLVKYRRERKRYREIEALWAAAKDGRVYASFSQVKTPHGRLLSSSPSLDEAVMAGAIKDKQVVRLFGDSEAALEILRKASGDSVLHDDLKQRKSGGDFLSGSVAVEGVNHCEILLFTAIGQPEPALCRRFLIRREQAAAIRSGVILRYQRLFEWLDEFKRLSIVQGFAKYGGNRKYLAGLRSSDIDKRNKAVRSAVRWLIRY